MLHLSFTPVLLLLWERPMLFHNILWYFNTYIMQSCSMFWCPCCCVVQCGRHTRTQRSCIGWFWFCTFVYIYHHCQQANKKQLHRHVTARKRGQVVWRQLTHWGHLVGRYCSSNRLDRGPEDTQRKFQQEREGGGLTGVGMITCLHIVCLCFWEKVQIVLKPTKLPNDCGN